MTGVSEVEGVGGIKSWHVYSVSCGRTVSYGHTRSNALDPVRSPKLSGRWLGQYCGGGPHGNTKCRNFSNFDFDPLSILFYAQKQWSLLSPATQWDS